MLLFRQHLKYTYVKTKTQKNKTKIPSKLITKLFLKRKSSLTIVINVASLSFVISVNIFWVINRFETVEFDNKLVEVVFPEPVNHISIHLEFIELKLLFSDIVLVYKLKLNYIQFMEVKTRHVIEEHILGVSYSVSVDVCSIHPQE